MNHETEPSRKRSLAGRYVARTMLLSTKRLSYTLTDMEVHLTPEKEAKLHQFATRTGKNTAQVMEEAVDRLLEYDANFIAAVEEGRAAANRGDLIEHDELVERVEQMLRS